MASQRKKYTRSELFNLAESIDDASIDRERLCKFKETKLTWDSLEDSAEPATYMDGFRQRPKLNRTLSNQQGLLQRTSTIEEAKIPHRISRMTSSPSLNYNKSHKSIADGRMMLDGGDLISSQARAKYAELIENLTASPPRTPHLSRHQAPVSRSASLNIAWESDEQQRHPINLRHETNRNRYGRDSEEPLSLPYIMTNHTTGGGPGKNLSPATVGFVGLDLDSFSHSPIRRLGSFANAAASSDQEPGQKNTESAEDDDFDLSSMISITVLSDIKTIRQEIHSSLPQQTSGHRTKQASIKPRDHRQGQDRKHPPQATGVRPLVTRSKTATEFNYRDRYQRAQMSDTRQTIARVPAYRGKATIFEPFETTISYQPPGYDPIPCTYNNWSFDQRRTKEEFRAPALLRQTSEASLSRLEARGPKDERAAKIIETFKAQVLARAVSTSLPVETKPEDERKLTPACRDRLGQTSDMTGGESTIADVEQKPTANVSEPKLVEAEAHSKSGSNQRDSDKLPSTARNISNIPRLIALHPKVTPRFEEFSEAMIAATTTDTEEAKNRPKITPTRPATLSSKFVSQYRQLRGKSLADELSESK